MNSNPVILYSLSTCSLCKDVQKLLAGHKVHFENVEVDRLEKDQQNEILNILKAYDDKFSFPTLVLGDEVITGYQKDKILKAIKAFSATRRFSLKRLFSFIRG